VSEGEGLRIRVRERGGGAPPPAGEPSPAAPPAAVGAPVVSVTAASPSAEVGMHARVREALCCPYCRESLTPDELEGAGDPQAPAGATNWSPPADLLTLSGLGVAGAVTAASLGWTTSLGSFGLSVSLATSLFLVVRNLGAWVSGRYRVGELLREARELWRRGETRVDGGAEEVVGCARPGCGAVYHAECWEECKTSYGACAVFGCGCRESTRLSQAQLRLRGLRLLLAAFLFPQRLVDAVRNVDASDGEGELTRLRLAIRARARASHANLWSGSRDQRQSWHTTAFSVLQLGLVIVGALVGYVVGFQISNHPGGKPKMLVSMLFGIGLPVFLVLALYASSWFGALALFAAKSLLSSEFSALARLGQQGAFLSRATGKK